VAWAGSHPPRPPVLPPSPARMSEQEKSEIPTMVPGQSERLVRRDEARRRQRRRRRQAAAAAGLAVLCIAVLALVLSGSPALRHSGSRADKKTTTVVVSGGPLAPAAVGGLAALWAPGNVVGSQPGTAAAYEAASKLRRLPGYLLIADRGNNRILVVDTRHRVVFRYPGPGDSARLVYDDDTFIEPGGAAIISNEEDNQAIVEVGIKTRSMRVLFGHPGVRGSDATHLNTPDRSP
jgi:hypothetical protein